MTQRQADADSASSEAAIERPFIALKNQAGGEPSTRRQTSAPCRREAPTRGENGATEGGARRVAASGSRPRRVQRFPRGEGSRRRAPRHVRRPARRVRPSGRAATERLRNDWRPREKAPHDRKRFDPRGRGREPKREGECRAFEKTRFPRALRSG